MSTVDKVESQDRIVVKINCRQPLVAIVFFILAYGFFEAPRLNDYSDELRISMRGLSIVALYLGLYFMMRIRRFELNLISRMVSFYAVKLFGLRRISASAGEVDCIRLHSKRVINGSHIGFMTISHICSIHVRNQSYDFYFSGKTKETLSFGSRMAQHLNCKLVDEMEKSEGTVGSDFGMRRRY